MSWELSGWGYVASHSVVSVHLLIACKAPRFCGSLGPYERIRVHEGCSRDISARYKVSAVQPMTGSSAGLAQRPTKTDDLRYIQSYEW